MEERPYIAVSLARDDKLAMIECVNGWKGLKGRVMSAMGLPKDLTEQL